MVLLCYYTPKGGGSHEETCQFFACRFYVSTLASLSREFSC